MQLTPQDLQHLPPQPLGPPSPTAFEVYMDDFIGAVQAQSLEELTHATMALLHAIHDVFPPPEITGSTFENPISIKKLSEDGPWYISKEILGWILNGKDRTMTTPQKKGDSILESLQQLCHQKCVKVDLLEKLQGQLTFLAVAIPLGKPLLGTLDAFIHKGPLAKHVYVTIPTDISAIYIEWTHLVQLLQSRPTHVRELVPTPPNFQGFCDASGTWGGRRSMVWSPVPTSTSGLVCQMAPSYTPFL